MTTDAFDRARGKLLVCEKRCDQCLFSSAKIVSDKRRKQVLLECRRKGTYFLCHKSTMAGRAVVCRGFFEIERNQACQVAARLGLVEFTEPD
jgi:hypothetical protein